MTKLETLVAAAQEGDSEAFGQIVVRFQDMAYATAYAILGDPHLAQDAAQEPFSTLTEIWPSCEIRQPFWAGFVASFLDTAIDRFTLHPNLPFH